MTRELELPDVIGWELPRALDEYRALGASWVITRPPRAHTSAPENNELDERGQNLEEDLRVVAVRLVKGRVVMVACAPQW